MKIGIIVGTRPEIIKMAPVIRACQQQQIDFFIIHSNQHYSESMDSVFFKELELPQPNYNLGVGSGLHSNQTGNILIKMEPILVDEKPDIVLVQGDTNTVLAGALAASKLNIKVGHIEAGLRSYDRMMPEETNRILTDHMSDYLFAVSNNQQQILDNEGIDKEKIHTVGNTVSDSLFQHLAIAEDKSEILAQQGLLSKQYFLVTAHRASNVDIKAHLQELFDLFDQFHQSYAQPIIWPIHPRTEAKIAEFGLHVPDYVKLLPPIGYLDFIHLQKHARLILTDSGGIQEEACLLGVPCITLRENTERPESVEVGANVLVGRDAQKALAAAKNWLANDDYHWENPFGDGHVAEKIINILQGKPAEAAPNATAANNKGTLAVIGMGYMGLPIASLIADAGYQVTGIDLNEQKVAQINQGLCPFDEVGLPELIKRVVESGQLSASTKIPSSDTYLVAVPTPHKDKQCDLSYVFSAVDAIAKVAQNGQTFIIESTISPTTSIQIQQRFANHGLDISVVHCPERAIPGQTLHELVNNDRIIGASDAQAAEQAKTIYQSFVKGQVFLTDVTTAECVKLVENTSRDVGIAFANELAQICEELKVNVHEVIKLANRHPRVNILSPGPGVGGHCIPIDPWFLVENTKTGELVRLARKINDQKPYLVAEQATQRLQQLSGNNVVLLGVAYKPNVDDCRETPAEQILQALAQQGVNVKYHDPHVPSWDCGKIEELSEAEAWADLVILVTGHDEYKSYSFTKPVLDSSGIVNPV